MRHITPRLLSDTNPIGGVPNWNSGAREQWLANVEGSAKRQRWIDSIKEISQITQSQTGMRLIADDYGMTKVAPVD